MTSRVFAAIVVFNVVVTQVLAAEPQAVPDDLSGQIKALQQERIKTLTSLVELYVTFYKMGTNTFDAVVYAQNDLVNSRLESAGTAEERIAVLTEHLKLVESLQELADQRFRAGISGQADVYRAKVLCLTTKINLLRERAKQKDTTH